MKKSRIPLLEIYKSDTPPNSVSLALHSLQELQIGMIKALATLSENDYDLHPLSELKRESISKKLDEVRYYLSKEVESVGDLIFSLKESVVNWEISPSTARDL